MSTKVGRTIGRNELVVIVHALVLAAKGRALPPETRKQLRAMVAAAQAVDVARRSAEKAPAVPRVRVREAERAVDAQARALDLYLGAFAARGDEEAQTARAIIFPRGRPNRVRGTLKVGELQLVEERLELCMDVLDRLDAAPFVASYRQALASYAAQVAAKVAQAVEKPAPVGELVSEANEAVRRYAELVRAYAVIARDGSDEVLLAPLAHRAAAMAAPGTEDPEPPSLRAA